MRAANSGQISHRRWLQLTQLAERIAGDYTDESGRTDPYEVLDDHGLTVSFNDYGDCFDGMLHYESGRFHVYCNLRRCTAVGHVRARFTLAHELGHYFIPEHHRALRSGANPFHPSFCNEPNPEHYVEAEADLFASRLLMPEHRFARAMSQNGATLDGVRHTANDLGTSLQATLIRCKDSMSMPCAFIWWREGAKPWWGVSRKLQLHGLKALVAMRENIPSGSATANSFASGVQSVPRILKTATVASIWFRDVASGSSRNIQLTEESLATPHGTVTWLSCAPSLLQALPSILGS